MAHSSTYQLSQKNGIRPWSIVISALILTSAVALVYFVSLPKYPSGSVIFVIMLCTTMPIYSYRSIKRELKYTRLVITDAGVTLTRAAGRTLHLNFADIKIVAKYKQGLVLVPKGQGKGQNVVMITKKFENFNEIEAKIDGAVA